MFGKRTFILFPGNFSEKVPTITEYHELEELNDVQNIRIFHQNPYEKKTQPKLSIVASCFSFWE